jgi:hypothetical protein
MPRALWQLMFLQYRGWLRQTARKAATLKGALFGLIGLAVLALWLVPLLLTPHEGVAPDTLRVYGPPSLLLYCILNLFLSTNERAIYFNPAEVNFLFTGPFTRRQLLGYKIVSAFLVSLPAAVFFTIMVQIHARWFLAAYVALVLAFQLMHWFALVLNLIAVTVGAHVYSRGRKVALGALVVLVIVVFIQASSLSAASGGWFQGLRNSPIWTTAMTPFRWFVETFLADNVADLLRFGALALLVNFTLLAFVFGLDAHYLEAAATTSERIYSQIQRIRRGEAVQMGLSSGKVLFSLPDFPWWGGVGPVLWRQLTTASRGLGRLVVLVIVFGTPLLIQLFTVPESPQTPHGEEVPVGRMAGSVFVVCMTLFVTVLTPFDFRGDLDRMEVLKTLPVRPWRLVLGQLLAPVFVVSTVQVALLGILASLGQSDGVPGGQSLTALAAFFIWPFNFLIYALENLFFLVFPTRLASSPGDFQAMGRNILLFLIKALVLGVSVGLAVVVSLGVAWLTGLPLLSLTSGWLTLVVCAAALIPPTAWAFVQFDVSRDMPA